MTDKPDYKCLDHSGQCARLDALEKNMEENQKTTKAHGLKLAGIFAVTGLIMFEIPIAMKYYTDLQKAEIRQVVRDEIVKVKQ